MGRIVAAFSAVASVVAASVAGAASAAAPPRQLAPATPWRLDYGDERCSLAQQYGSGDQAVLLQIDSYGSWSGFSVTLAGKGVPRSIEPTGLGAVRFPRDPAGRQVTLYNGITGPGGNPWVSFVSSFEPYNEYERWHKLTDKAKRSQPQPDRFDPNYEGTINAFVVAFNSSSAVELQVGNLAAPLAALRECVDELNKSWGLDPEVQKSLSRAAWPKEADIEALQYHYPSSMADNGVDARVPVRFTIDAKGNAISCVVHAISCVVQVPTVDPTLKEAICDNLRHFDPALDANGQPVQSEFHEWLTYLVKYG